MTTQEILILTVSQLTQAIKLQLESSFPLVWVKGEVSNLKLQSSGHLYFSIKDNFAQISCVAFRQDLLKMPLPPKVGDQILIRAELNVWPPKGGYQLIVRELSHVGRGELLLKLELLKQKLQQAGYFAVERKRPLPRFPKRIGIVTSPTGAVIQDIINVLSRRLNGFHLILNPVRVQGEGAAEEIVQAIKQFNEHQLVDLIVVCRGGGSFEDLMPFNSEIVAHAIFQSQIPIVSAVGHETDTSISDLVADVRAPTPSAAAELISHETEKLLSQLAKAKKQLSQQLFAQVSRHRSSLHKLARQPLFTSSTALLGMRIQSLDEIEDAVDETMKRSLMRYRQELQRLQKRVELAKPSVKIQTAKAKLIQLRLQVESSMNKKLKEAKQKLLTSSDSLDKKWRALQQLRKKAFAYPQFEKQIPFLVQKLLATKKKELDQLAGHLESLHPKQLLAKGYTICFSQKDGSVISSTAALTIGQSVRIAFVDGEVQAEITSITQHETRTTNAPL